MSNPIQVSKGKAEWVHKNGDSYIASGTDRNGKRFRIESGNWGYIEGINVFKGSKWLKRDGIRYLIKRIHNW